MRLLLSFLSWLLWVHGYIILALLPVTYLLYERKFGNPRPEVMFLA